MGKTIKEQFVEALENGITHKAVYLLQFMKNEINEPYDYRSPLVWAKRYGNEKVAQALRDMGAVEDVDKEGMIDELLKILWRNYAEAPAEYDEKRAIELIKDGANIEKKEPFGFTALILASEYGRLEVVKALLDAGAKVDEKGKGGFTALIMASWYGHLDVVKTLLDAGAKVDEKDNGDDTALIKALKYGHLDVVKALLDAGAKVNEKCSAGGTALTKASRNDNINSTKALLDAGADVTITDDFGKTAIDYADNDEIKKLLNQALIKQKMQKFKKKISGFFGREQR